MQKTTKFLAAASVFALGLGIAATDAHAGKKDKERCYGVVKAGKNHCGSADGAHSCAGLATKDADPNEWVYLPKGTCDLLAGGSTTGPAKN